MSNETTDTPVTPAAPAAKKPSPKSKEALGVSADSSICWLPVVLTNDEAEAVRKIAGKRNTKETLVKVADVLMGIFAQPLKDAMPALLEEASTIESKTKPEDKELPTDADALDKLTKKIESDLQKKQDALAAAKAALAAAKSKKDAAVVEAPTEDAEAE
jgi:hypothetical protein